MYGPLYGQIQILKEFQIYSSKLEFLVFKQPYIMYHAQNEPCALFSLRFVFVVNISDTLYWNHIYCIGNWMKNMPNLLL